MARRGALPWTKLKCKLANKNCRFQRGRSLFRHLFKDLQNASRALSMETRRDHPILFVDPTCWGGDSIEELLQIAVDANQIGDESAEPGLYGLFFDKKDVHYQVSRLRRKLFIHNYFLRQALPLHGEQAEPSETLVALRKKVSKDELSLKVLGVEERAGEPVLSIPTPLSLPFRVSTSLKRRLDDLRDTYSNKRCRIQANTLMMPSSLSIEELRSKYIVHEEQEHVIHGSSVRVFQISMPPEKCESPRSEDVENLNDARPAGRPEGYGAYYLYLANNTADKIELPMHARVTQGTLASFYNYLDPADEEKLDALPSTLVHWPWRLTMRSLFRFGAEVGRFRDCNCRAAVT